MSLLFNFHLTDKKKMPTYICIIPTLIYRLKALIGYRYKGSAKTKASVLQESIGYVEILLKNSVSFIICKLWTTYPLCQ